MQDTDCKHAAKSLNKWLQNSISVLEWLNQSPDFNPTQDSGSISKRLFTDDATKKTSSIFAKEKQGKITLKTSKEKQSYRPHVTVLLLEKVALKHWQLCLSSVEQYMQGRRE